MKKTEQLELIQKQLIALENIQKSIDATNNVAYTKTIPLSLKLAKLKKELNKLIKRVTQ